MDKRQMRKVIQIEALTRFSNYVKNQEFPEVIIGLVIDRDYDSVSRAQIRRFKQVLEEMIDNAESKL